MYVNIDSETNVFTHESINRLIIVNMILFIDFVVLSFVAKLAFNAKLLLYEVSKSFSFLV